MDLREAGVGEHGALLVALPSGRTVRVHGVGREEEDVAVTAGSEYDGVCAETLDFARHQVAGDDTARLAVDHDQIEHLVTRVAHDGTLGNLTVQCGIGTQQQLLSRLAAGVERTRYLSTAERTVGQQTAVVAGKRNTLSYALVDDVVRHLGQTIDVRLAGAVVTALDRIVEQTEDGVVVVLIVLGSVDTALSGDGVGAAGRVGNAEHLDVVAQFAQRSGCGGAAQTGADDDDVEFTLVGRTHYLDLGLVLGPFLGERTLRYAGI